MTESFPEDSTIAVVIPTYNAAQHILSLLNSLKTQTLRPTQIIVIDSGSTDETLEIAKSQNCEIITINRTDFDHGTTRNLAISNTKSKFVVFLTQDAIPTDKNMIAELIKPLESDSNIAVCYGRQLPRPNAGSLESFARQFNYPTESFLKTKNDIEALGLKTFFCSNSCSVIRLSIFNKLGGFKNNVIVNEDMLFAAKAITHDYSVYYSAKAKAYHSHNFTLAQTFKRYFNIGRFFADNRWLLKQSNLKRYGSGMIKAGIKTFWQKRLLRCIVALVIEFIVKAIACKLGWYYQLLSRKK